jgi:hypothetical protein
VRGCSRAAQRGRGGLGPSKKFSMGTNLVAAHKVFVKMAAREKVSKFGNSFGGSHSYNHRDRMVVVVVILVLICKFSNLGLIFSLFQGLLYSLLFWST